MLLILSNFSCLILFICFNSTSQIFLILLNENFLVIVAVPCPILQAFSFLIVNKLIRLHWSDWRQLAYNKSWRITNLDAQLHACIVTSSRFVPKIKLSVNWNVNITPSSYIDNVIANLFMWKFCCLYDMNVYGDFMYRVLVL